MNKSTGDFKNKGQEKTQNYPNMTDMQWCDREISDTKLPESVSLNLFSQLCFTY